MRAVDPKVRDPVILVPVRSLGDAMALRRVRNGVRRFLTRDTSEIGWLRQVRWWWAYRAAFEDGGVVAWLVCPTWGRPAIGYGLLRRDPGRRWWVTGAIVEGARGYGYGRALFATLTAAAIARGREAWLEVREDNAPARRLYESLGYRAISVEAGTVTMICRR